LEEPQLCGAQVRRFLMLHKELDPDDQEITRTRKVRRGFIAQKYAPLVEALYSTQDHVSVEAKVTYEDGRTGTVRADVRIRDAEAHAGGEKACAQRRVRGRSDRNAPRPSRRRPRRTVDPSGRPCSRSTTSAFDSAQST